VLFSHAKLRSEAVPAPDAEPVGTVVQIACLEESLSEVPGDARPGPSLKALLRHLAGAAQSTFLGLAALIDLLEGLDDVWGPCPGRPQARVADEIVAPYPVVTRAEALAVRERGQELIARANRELITELRGRRGHTVS